MKRNKINYYKIFFLSGIILSLALTSCRKDDEITDEYYIKYELNSNTIYSGGKLSVEYTNEHHESIITEIPTKTKWEINVGPVKKGFNSNVKVSEIGNNYGKLTLSGQISSTKNNSPFAIKKADNSSTPRTSLQLNYTIDY